MQTSTPRYPKPVFGQQHNFYPALKERVKASLANYDQHPYRQTAARYYWMQTLFILIYCFLLLFGNNAVCLFAAYLSIGMVTFMLFIGSMHDAAHEVLF